MTGGGLLPRVAPTLVERPRLFALLDRGTLGPVTLVAAPAGSGKTMLLSSWLRTSPPAGAVAWVSVRRDETDATHFWGMVMDALRGSGAIAAGDPLATLVPAPLGSQEEFVQRLLEGLGRLSDPLLLVLDDLHHLRSEDGLATLEQLLSHAPAQLRTLIAGRRDPKLGLHRLRLAGDLLEIRAADLDFTADEAGELLMAAGVAVDGGDLAKLHERTEGWAAGLRLAAMSLARHDAPDRFVAEFSGSERTVADYLLGEVLASQPPEVRDLLLRTSILERVNGPLADLLTGRSDGARLLHELEEANALVVATDVARSWFRCHHLLGDLLRLELQREAPDEIPRLHRLAAAWHAEQGHAVEAIRHAQLGEDWAAATDLLGRHWVHLLLDGEEATLRSLLDGFPGANDAELAAITAAGRLAESRWSEADALLAAAEEAIDQVPPERRRRADTALATVRLLRARHLGGLDAVVDGASAIHAGEGGPELQALALMTLGIGECWTGRLPEAEAHLERALALAGRLGSAYLELGTLGALGGVAILTGRLGQAEEWQRQAVAVADRVGWATHPFSGVVYANLGSVLVERGRLAEADAWLDRAGPILARAPEPAASVGHRHTQGMVLLVRGRVPEALSAFREAERLADELRAPHFVALVARQWQLRAQLQLGELEPVRAALEEERLPGAQWCNLAARACLLAGDTAGALAALTPVFDGTAFVFHVNVEIEANLLHALARPPGEERERSVERALALAEPEGRVWMALTIPGVAELLGAHPLHRTAHAAHLKLLLDQCGGVEPAPAQELPDPLSERELAVLRFLPTNLSASEIGGELYLSVHTVKTHMRKLYAKLDAHTRAEAVQRGRALGLLAPARRS
jgi:LuxR family maltose regulon positive regulatory protein